jgi:flagellar biogenesis protein FliO
MSAVVWANILLALPFLIAFIGIPLWMTFKLPQTGPDHAEARAYLRTRSAFAEARARRQAQRVKAAA